MTSASAWENRFLREKNARMQAENLLESKSLELYESNVSLKRAQQDLQAQVTERTRKLESAVSILKDEITKREQAEKKLRLAHDNAIETSDLKTKFLASMSHEIRTPLNAIIGFSGLLLDSPLDSSQKEQMLNVKSSGILLLRLINDILDLSKIEANMLDIEFTKTELNLLIRQSIALLMPEAERKGLKFSYSKPAGVTDKVVVDSGRIQQILLNLLSNSVRYSERGTINIDLEVVEGTTAGLNAPPKLHSELKPEDTGLGTIIISVKDEGIGMSEKDLQTLFKPFTQFAHTRQGSTGLGLTICKRISELMGGTISVQSEVQKGSVFTVRMPCGLLIEKKSEPVPVTPEVEITVLDSNAETGIWLMDNTIKNADLNSSRDAAHDKPLSILLADDYKVNRMVLHAQLEQLGYRADAVANGEEVLRALHARSYDLVLMDIRMPVMDGVECTKRIRRNKDSHQPYIAAVTASALAGDKETFEQAGMDAYITKPVNVSELTQILNQAYDSVSKTGSGLPANSSGKPVEESSLDLSELYASLGDKTDELLSGVIPVYLRELPAREALLRNAYADGDSHSLAQVCHGLKGSCSIMGAKNLADKFNRIEKMGYDNKLPQVSEIDELLVLSQKTGTRFTRRTGTIKRQPINRLPSILLNTPGFQGCQGFVFRFPFLLLDHRSPQSWELKGLPP